MQVVMKRDSTLSTSTVQPPFYNQHYVLTKIPENSNNNHFKNLNTNNNNSDYLNVPSQHQNNNAAQPERALSRKRRAPVDSF